MPPLILSLGTMMMRLLSRLAARFNPYRGRAALAAFVLLILISTGIKYNLVQMNTSSLTNVGFLLIVLVVVILVAISAIALQFNPHDGVLRRCAGENVFVSIYKFAISVIMLSILAGLISAVSFYLIKASYLAVIHS